MSTKAPLTGLSEAARVQACERFALLRPFLEERIPLRRVAREQRIALRTARRWVSLYRREGLAGLARVDMAMESCSCDPASDDQCSGGTSPNPPPRYQKDDDSTGAADRRPA